MVSKCSVTLTVEYDFVLDGDSEGVEEVIKEVCKNIQLSSMGRILDTYGELLSVATVPIKAIVTPLTPKEQFTITLQKE